MVLYIFSVIATQLYGDIDPEHFGDLGKATLSMFQITTGDDWAAVVRPTTDAEPASWAFFILYIVLATYIVLNLFIAVAVEALDRETEEANEELATEMEEAMDESTDAILASLEELKAQVQSLEARLDDQSARGPAFFLRGRRRRYATTTRPTIVNTRFTSMAGRQCSWPSLIT
jgi:voltage-gated sodium channel